MFSSELYLPKLRNSEGALELLKYLKASIEGSLPCWLDSPRMVMLVLQNSIAELRTGFKATVPLPACFEAS